MRQRSAEIILKNESLASFHESLVFIMAQIGNIGIHEATKNLSRYTWEVSLTQNYMCRKVILPQCEPDNVGKDRKIKCS